jgi:DNA invertase Pin-like site-specific DNA recombinase
LEGIPLDKRFIEYASAKSMNRPELQKMLDYVREDDIIFVHHSDRLARNLQDFVKILCFCRDKNISIRFVTQKLEYNADASPMSMFMLHCMVAVAELELSLNEERRKEGIAIAQKAGKYKGGQKKLNKEKVTRLRHLLTTRMSITDIASEFKVSRRTIYNYMKELGIDYGK